MADTTTTERFATTSAVSVVGVFGVLAFAYVCLAKLLPKTASKMDRITFMWLVGDLNLNRVDVTWRMEPLMISYLRRSTH